MLKSIHNFSQLSVEESIKAIGTPSINSGLTEEAASALLERIGPNTVSLKDRWHLIKTLIEPFKSLFVVILIIAALISFWIGKIVESAVIMLILLINASIYYVQNYSTTRILKSLEQQQQPHVIVRRDAKYRKIPSSEIVPGDIVILKEGMKVPADGRVTNDNNLKIDESSITGESERQHKDTSKINSNKPIYEQANMVFSGTLVVAGQGEFVVTATGMNTEYGRIARLSKKPESKSPIQVKIDSLTKQLIILVAIVAIFTFFLKLSRGVSAIESARFILSLVVSAIPEGLPIATIVIMVLGIKSMAKHKAIVRNLTAVETLGQVTLIATDKTGTITENSMHLVDSWVPGKNTHFASVATHSVDPGSEDEIDKIIYSKFSPENNLKQDKLLKRVIPFEQKLRTSGAVWSGSNQKDATTYIKGAPEEIIKACKLSPSQKLAIHNQLHKFSGMGLRVIGIAAKKGDIKINSANINGFSFAGLIAMGDTIREEVREAVGNAHRAGIDVIMLTGDHRQTAGYFARQSSISNTQNALEGSDIVKLDHTEIRHILKTTKAIGRVLPEHKYHILESLQRTNITAMTGDGINDVPAIRRANVGIAVGSGTDAAKEASDIIIVDNNFATIIEAISQGRAIVANIRKVITYVLATNLGEIFTIVGALILNLPLPITALQILWINVVTDSFAMIPIGLEKPEKDLMANKPNHPSEPLISKRRKYRMLLMALIMSVITLTVYTLSLPYGEDSAKAMAFITLVVAQWANAINSRSDNRSFIRGLLKPNWWLYMGILIALILQITVMFTPLSTVFDTQALTLNQILIAIGVFVLILITGDILKKTMPIGNKG